MPMSRGDRGTEVTAWQRFLILHAQLDPAAETAEFDAATDAATRSYQASRGLPADGIVGEQTLAAARIDSFDPSGTPAPYRLLYGLASAATDDPLHPGALVYAPPALDPAAWGLVVYLHGIDNNAENVARAAGDRPSADLVGHLARAGRSALLLVPELRFNHGSPDPGRLVADGALRRLVEEVLARVGDAYGGLSTARLVRTVLISHSGGFHAAAALATRGGLPVDELYLLDSLYGEEDAFFGCADAVLAAPGQRSLINLYGSSTERRSLALLARVRAAATARGIDAAFIAGSDTPVAAEQLWPGAPGAAFLSQRVPIAHAAMPAALVGRLLAASRLPGPGVA